MSYNYDLEVMLEENRLKSALSSLIQWFKDKIRLVKEKIATLINKLRGKELPPEKKSAFQKVKASANSAINNCKQGISACKQGAADKAKACKDKVMSSVSNMSTGVKILAGVGAVAGGVVIGRKIKGKFGNKNGNDHEEKNTKKDKDVHLTGTFYGAVKDGNKQRLRIMLKNSMIVDPSFKEFNVMNSKASSVSGLYVPHNGEKFETDKSKWDKSYLDRELVKLVSNFSKERVNHVKSIVNYIYNNK